MKGIDNILKPLYDLWHKVMDKLSVNNNRILVDGKEVIVKMIVENIKGLTDEQCDALQCGDVVAKKTGNMFHLYQVTYKEDKHGICLTYQAAGLQETQSYDYVEGHWVYNSEDLVETNVADAPSGTATSMLGLDSNGKVVKDSVPTVHTDAEIKALAVDAVEEATSGTATQVIGLDSNGNMVKASMPEGKKLYNHFVSLRVGTFIRFHFHIVHSKSTSLNFDDIISLVTTSSSSYIEGNGFYNNNGSPCYLCGIGEKNSGGTLLRFRYYDVSGTDSMSVLTTNAYTSSNIVFEGDIIKEI